MTNINLKSLIDLAGLILIIIGAFFSLCIPVALIFSEPVMPFVYPAILTLIPGLLLYVLLKSPLEERISAREGYLGVTLAWVILTTCGTLPYFFSGVITNFPDAWFESTSGFTTTGSSILADVESVPMSILFWRSLTHWIGGVGIILLVIIVLPRLKIGGYNLFSLESSVKQKILPKTKSIAISFLVIYLVITVLEVAFLLIGGLGLFESICTTFGTVATGGFTIRNNSLADYSPYLQYVVGIFMFLSAVNFINYFLLVKRDFRKIKENDELWFYFFFTTAAIVFITLTLYFSTYRDFSTSFRHSFFQVIAQITTTGAATTDYMQWPQVGWSFMFILMFAGGCTGSTTGGIKMARHLLALKNIRSLFVRLRHPNVVTPIKLNGKIVPENINLMMLLFVFIYILIFLIGAMIMAISGIPINEAAGASVTAMSNVGPGLGASGNMGNFSAFNHFAVVTMTLEMLIGRLEIFTVLALFTRAFWRN